MSENVTKKVCLLSSVEYWWVVQADNYMQSCEYFMSHAYFIAAAHYLIYCRAWIWDEKCLS